MTDPTENYKKIVDAAEQRAEGIYTRAEALAPLYPRSAEDLSREEQHRDYQTAKVVPDGMRVQLREWRQQYGLDEALLAFMKWDKENRG